MNLFRLLSLTAAAGIAAAASGQPSAVPVGYSVLDAKVLRTAYPYLTAQSVAEKLSPAVVQKLPAADVRRLVILDITFKANGDAKAMVELDPTQLEARWANAAGQGSAPALGVHLSRDFIVLGPGAGFLTSMRPDTYQVFAIIPRGITRLHLAQRQSDGGYKVVKANIAVPAGR